MKKLIKRTASGNIKNANLVTTSAGHAHTWACLRGECGRYCKACKQARRETLLDFCKSATQTGLTRYELTFDYVGRSIEICVAIGDVVGVRYANGSRASRESICKGKRTGDYDTLILNLCDPVSGKRLYRRPGIHQLIAYTYPPLREQYWEVRATGANPDINHMTKDRNKNGAVFLEAVSRSENSKHSKLCKDGEFLSMSTMRENQTRDIFGDFFTCGVIDAKLNDMPYVDVMSKMLSEANLPIETTNIKARALCGNNVLVDISSTTWQTGTIWQIIAELYKAGAVKILDSDA